MKNAELFSSHSIIVGLEVCNNEVENFYFEVWQQEVMRSVAEITLTSTHVCAQQHGSLQVV